ncbi:hypothetical protein GCM10023346_31550 [Arthrobacter gyeryongensis]|uniref:4-oxalocrotonate tautomerase n=1 Tax=Arthrobacter gyeryongensis TaxID=1650592 RepID=A0ABP9SJ10_9MICC
MAKSIITVKIEDRASRDRQLEHATLLLREEATRCGILVTRVDFTTFIVTLSPGIPYGLTHEIDMM